MFETTFSPIQIGSMTLKNRLLTSAMEAVMCDPDGYVTDRYVNYIEARAKGGFGMVVTGMITVCRSGHGFRCCAANWDDSYIPGLSRLADAVHKYEGAKLCMQIGHAGRQGRTRVTGLPTEAPTGLKDPTMADTPHELTTEEVKGLVKTFGQAALRAKKAGFDAVEIHAAHGYLVHGFFSPLSNKRTDCYGGNLRNRARFCCEIIQEIKAVCGKDFPVVVKISTTELEGSRLSIADTKAISMMLEEAGADCINATMGAYATPGYYPIVPPAVASVADNKTFAGLRGLVPGAPNTYDKCNGNISHKANINSSHRFFILSFQNYLPFLLHEQTHDACFTLCLCLLCSTRY